MLFWSAMPQHTEGVTNRNRYKLRDINFGTNPVCDQFSIVYLLLFDKSIVKPDKLIPVYFGVEWMRQKRQKIRVQMTGLLIQK